MAMSHGGMGCGRDGVAMKRWMGLACALLCVLALALVGCEGTHARGDSVAQGQADKLAAWKGCKNGTPTLAEGGKGTFLGDEVEWWLDGGVGKITVVGESGKRETFDIEQLPGGISVTSADGGMVLVISLSKRKEPYECLRQRRACARNRAT